MVPGGLVVLKILSLMQLAASAAVLTVAAPAVALDADWRFHGNDAASTKSTSLDQVHRGNIDELTLAWRWVSTDFELAARHAVDAGKNNQAMPLVVNGVLYTSTPLNLVFALDAVTG